MKIEDYNFRHDFGTIIYRLQSTDITKNWTQSMEENKTHLALQYAEACLDDVSFSRLMKAEFKTFITGTQLKMEFMGSSPVTFKNGDS